MIQMPKVLLVALCLGLLAACDGGDDDSNGGPAPVPGRGTLVESPPARARTASVTELLAAFAFGGVGQDIAALSGTPVCAVDVHTLRYRTVGAAGEATIASGALMVPTGLDPQCQGPRPVLLYAHGTTTNRAFNFTNLDDPDNPEGVIVATLFASQGYIVVAPNYAGYDTSTLGYHAYLNADQQSKDMIDALAAARSALPTTFAPTVRDNGKLFITGYSQGGYVAMATHRAMQAAGLAVTASAPMSGPYALAAFGDTVFNGSVDLGAPIFFTMLLTGYQRAYGNLYASPTDVFSANYASGIETLLPSTSSRGQLYAEGRLPQFALFSSTPPDPAYAAVTPATAPPDMAAVHAVGFGSSPLITNSYRLAYLQDMQANPDGGLPTTTTGLPAASPGHPLRRAFKTNDLRNWSPTAPVLMCGGTEDPTVFYSNTQLMQGYWAAAGVTTPVTVLDVDTPPVSGDRYEGIKDGFTTAKNLFALTAVAGGASDGGDMAVAEAYHSQLVPPFCLAAVRSFFSDF